jgi:SNF2 family DNA or RNA helicase
MTLKEIQSKQIVLTTYGMIASRGALYQSLLWKVQWNRLVCDEAHHMRNPKTNICKGAFRILSDIKWMVTGTPIQNCTTDIRVLFALLGKVIRGEEQLREYIRIYVLRRTKKSVGIILPEHKKTKVMVDWESKIEENLAASIHAQLPLFDVSVENVNKIIEYLNYESPLPLFVRARQSCINPQLLKKCMEKMKGNGLIPNDFKMKRIPTMSKISAVVKKVKSQPKEKKKIIFSYYRGEIDELKRRLINEDYVVSIMDGRSKRKEKEDACDPEKAPDILIAQIQSASEGLNLQHFSQVYFTSPHWNPAVEEQAIARAHRIGQENQVETFHFEMSPFKEGGLTIDNYCMNVQKRKRELMKLID